MTASLYEISAELREILAELEENGGELTDAIEDRLTVNRNELEQKLNSYFYVIKEREAIINQLKEEMAFLNKKIKSKQIFIERLKSFIGIAVDLYGIPTKTGTLKVETNIHNFTKVPIKSLLLREDVNPLLDADLQPFTKANVSLAIPASKLNELTRVLNNFMVRQNLSIPEGSVAFSPSVDKKALQAYIESLPDTVPDSDDVEMETIKDKAVIKQDSYIKIT